MQWGGYSISLELYDWLVSHVPAGATLLELGSGQASAKLAERWDLWSVEHSADWVGRYHSQYLYAPLTSHGWYDLTGVTLPEGYACILVDGPPNQFDRRQLLDHLDLFETSAAWVLDDTHRLTEHRLSLELGARLGREATLHECADGKGFATIDAAV